MEDLKGQIYDVGTSSQANYFVTMTKDIDIYAGWKCTDPQEIRIAIDKLDEVMSRIPKKQEGFKNDICTLLLWNDLDAYVKRKQIYQQNKATIYPVVLSQCMEATKNRLEG